MENYEEEQSKAIPFIIYGENGEFQIAPEAELFLKNLSNDYLGVLSIVGKYRTGKSFFVNRVLLDKKQGEGFQVGPTINPCTKGIWIWSKVIDQKNKNGEKQKILILDTEGFGASTDADRNKDNRIFLFAMLLSSYLIYNSVGTINEMSLQDLSLLINLVKSVTYRNGSAIDSEDVSEIFPKLLWVIRDFTLQMQDENGNSISENQYLENALDLKKGVSDKVEQKNRVRKLIKHCFKDRKCCCFVRPAENEQDLQNLDKLPDYRLREKFVQQLNQVKKTIFSEVPTKVINQGKTKVTGQILIQLAKSYIEVVNKGQCPNIENTWTSVCNAQNFELIKQLLSKADQRIEQLLKENTSLEDLDGHKKELFQEIYQLFKNKTISQDVKQDLSQYEQQIKREIEDKFRILEAQCSSQIDDLVEKLKGKIINENFTDFYQFQNEMAQELPDNIKSNFRTFNILFKSFNNNVEMDLNMKLKKEQKLLEIEREANKQLKIEMNNIQLLNVQKQMSSVGKEKSVENSLGQVQSEDGQIQLKVLNTLQNFLSTNDNKQLEEIYEMVKDEFQTELEKVLDSNKNIQEALSKLEERNQVLEKSNEDLRKQNKILEENLQNLSENQQQRQIIETLSPRNEFEDEEQLQLQQQKIEQQQQFQQQQNEQFEEQMYSPIQQGIYPQSQLQTTNYKQSQLRRSQQSPMLSSRGDMSIRKNQSQMSRFQQSQQVNYMVSNQPSNRSMISSTHQNNQSQYQFNQNNQNNNQNTSCFNNFEEQQMYQQILQQQQNSQNQSQQQQMSQQQQLSQQQMSQQQQNEGQFLSSVEVVSLEKSNEKQMQIRSSLNDNFYTVWRSIKEFYDLYKSIINLFPKSNISSEEMSHNFLIRNSNRFRSFLGILQNNKENQPKEQLIVEKQSQIYQNETNSNQNCSFLNNTNNNQNLNKSNNNVSIRNSINSFSMHQYGQQGKQSMNQEENNQMDNRNNNNMNKKRVLKSNNTSMSHLSNINNNSQFFNNSNNINQNYKNNKEQFDPIKGILNQQKLQQEIENQRGSFFANNNNSNNKNRGKNHSQQFFMNENFDLNNSNNFQQQINFNMSGTQNMNRRVRY
ncbi:P-loop containing nucleoside triphosphate hydrolase [Pseudocohnilembus persalinus]|uniref:p-loop containing nucleoside triphosphate hydrolase n=1 Tax=Pseudocohnilembus persalinus TaxID=266149 RepID=A0A0V0QWQ1_PSEPJ|nr:P-loop containing nucleoside triphosphate hydrolase [Pseudocohnilembus persalinus]|eukprot:KRX06654.1 P-loop containing nucleoside triphosphate hydrolase [Pseudocohnilembus persalinus]